MAADRVGTVSDRVDPTETVIYFVSHASVLLRSGDHWLLTDPWYEAPAFSTWVPSPPPAMNPAMLLGLAATGRLAVVVSHGHPDHLDRRFLDRLPAGTTVLAPRQVGLRSHLPVSVLDEEPVTFGPFTLRSHPHLHSPGDAVISIETPDAFVLHANDSWDLGPEARGRIAATKPPGKASLLMAQGASAAGHPLTYPAITDPDRALREKNDAMLRSIAATAADLGFDRCLAYACFAKIAHRGYAFRAPTVHGDHANAVAGDRFIDLSPGDVYLPGRDLVIGITRSLHVDQRGFPHIEPATDFGEVSEATWDERYAPLLDRFLDGLASDEPIAFAIEVTWGRVVRRTAQRTFGEERKKVCRVDAAVLASVLEGRIPFEDLYTGYLAEWFRTPDVYNRRFLEGLIDRGYAWQAEVLGDGIDGPR
ncbi:MAG: hypothetical protein JWN67_3675 [Actinomycetia bacterium]|nr:hypothetical protein [Actinomycetes bacterium]